MLGWTVGLLVLSSLSNTVLSFRFLIGNIQHCSKREFMCEHLSHLFLNCSSTKSCDADLKFESAVQYCIEKKHICDGQAHCPDGSDEKYCPYVFEYTPDMAYRAGFHRFVSGSCDSGEVQCVSSPKEMSDGSVNYECVEKNYICDGDVDCEDGSDEKHCPYELRFPLERITYVDSYPLVACRNKNKAYPYFSCEDPLLPRECVRKSFVCDGAQDCTNGLDEMFCPHDLNFSHPVPTRLVAPPEEVIRTTTEQVTQEKPDQVTQKVPKQTTQESLTRKPSFISSSTVSSISMGTQMESLIRENTLAMEKVVDAVKQLELVFQRRGIHSPPATSDPARR